MDKKVALILSNIDEENDVRICLGEIVNKENEYYFINRSENWNITISPNKLEEIKEVPGELKQVLLHADFYFSMTMGNLPNNSSERFISTGIKWV